MFTVKHLYNYQIIIIIHITGEILLKTKTILVINNLPTLRIVINNNKCISILSTL